VAILLGGLIGGEREIRDKSAGFRTMILICLGATLFTMLSAYLAGGNNSTGVVANIITGIGFLGAGAILRDGNHITGLTTASSIWLVAAVGMALGAGQYPLAVAVTLAALVVLWFFPALETKIDMRHTRIYQVVCASDLQAGQKLESNFAHYGLKLQNSKCTKSRDFMTFTWKAIGPHNTMRDSSMPCCRILRCGADLLDNARTMIKFRPIEQLKLYKYSIVLQLSNIYVRD
jgi:putative Mg2+ transporter-C (MgtC) family protein